MHLEEFKFLVKSNSNLEAFERSQEIIFRIGNQPDIINLYDLLGFHDQELQGKLATLYKDYDLYLIKHAVGAITTKETISSILYTSKIESSKAISTLGMIPSTQFKEILGGKIEVSANVSAEIDTSGENLMAAFIQLALESIEAPSDFEVSGSFNANIWANLGFLYKIPVIQTLGLQSDICTWELRPNSGDTLNGDQQLLQIIKVSKGGRQIKCVLGATIYFKKPFHFFQKYHKDIAKELMLDLPYRAQSLQ